MHVRPFLIAAALLSANLAAHADTFNFTLNGAGGGFSGTGVLTADPTGTSGAYLVTGISGSGTTGPIAIGGFSGNDNLFFPTSSSLVDSSGLSFYDQNPSGVFQVDLYSTGVGTYAVKYNEINTTASDSGTLPVTFTATSTNVAATPEPSGFVLLGTGIVGALGVARRRFSTRLTANAA